MTTGSAAVDRWIAALAKSAPPLSGEQIETISKLMSRAATNTPRSAVRAESRRPAA
jgi:hypothetical protein